MLSSDDIRCQNSSLLDIINESIMELDASPSPSSMNDVWHEVDFAPVIDDLYGNQRPRSPSVMRRTSGGESHSERGSFCRSRGLLRRRLLFRMLVLEKLLQSAAVSIFSSSSKGESSLRRLQLSILRMAIGKRQRMRSDSWRVLLINLPNRNSSPH